jgi:hypothetical protein
MDDHWYYAEASDQSFGPMSLEKLGHILRAKANAADFLVWCHGMADWGRAGDQVTLRRYFQPPLVPTLPGAPKIIPALDRLAIDADVRTTQVINESSKLHPWRRYFARMFDLYVFVLFFFLFLGMMFPALFASTDKSPDLLYSIFGLAAYAIFEGFCLNVFGSSLGKRLYGIRLIRTSDDGFTLPVSFKRSFAVWVRGLGFGIPIAAVFTLTTAYRTLMREKQTSWDHDFQCITSHRKLSPLRWLLIVAVWLLLLSTYVFLVALADYTKL